MSAIDERRRADIAALQRLAAASGGQLQVLQLPTAVRSRVELRLHATLVGGPDYPAQRRGELQLAIDLPARYPFEPPVVRIVGGTLLHPNVFDSGVVCIGSRWRASEGLDLFVRRVARLLCFDPLLVNLQSLANPSAGNWYRGVLRRHPQAFPTAHIDWPLDGEPAAANATAADTRVIRECPSCAAKLRLPAGRSGQVECPRCHREFDART